MFLFVVVNGEGRGGEKNQLVGGDVVKLWKKKVRRGICCKTGEEKWVGVLEFVKWGCINNVY